MTRDLSISQEFEIRVNWKKVAEDLKKEFKIDIDEEEIEQLCLENEMNYLTVQDYEQEIEEIHINDLTLDEQEIDRQNEKN